MKPWGCHRARAEAAWEQLRAMNSLGDVAAQQKD